MSSRTQAAAHAPRAHEDERPGPGVRDATAPSSPSCSSRPGAASLSERGQAGARPDARPHARAARRDRRRASRASTRPTSSSTRCERYDQGLLGLRVALAGRVDHERAARVERAARRMQRSSATVERVLRGAVAVTPLVRPPGGRRRRGAADDAPRRPASAPPIALLAARPARGAGRARDGRTAAGARVATPDACGACHAGVRHELQPGRRRVCFSGAQPARPQAARAAPAPQAPRAARRSSPRARATRSRSRAR